MKTSLVALLLAVLTLQCGGVAQENRDSDTDAAATRDIEETQTAVDRAARQADVNYQNNINNRQSDQKIGTEVERSTGKENKNPAENNPTLVNPPVLTRD